MSHEVWPAPRARHPVIGTVEIPGSKSITNRALLLAALADGPSRIVRPLRSRDTELMAGALRSLGVPVREQDGAWVVAGGAPLHGGCHIDVGNAGTVARFLPALATLAAGPVALDGDPRVRERPLAPLLAALRNLGAEIDDAGRGRLPLVVHGHGRLAGGTAEVAASESSQFVSGLLLAAPRFDAGVAVHAVGPVPSAPHLAMNVDLLRAFGAQVEASERRWVVAPGRLTARELTVEPDLSSAAPFLAAAVATGGRVRVAGWPADSRQPGAALPGFLAGFGAQVLVEPAGLSIVGAGRPGGLDADLADYGELVPVLAALAALGSRPSRFRGIGHLRGQESDRLAALARELTALGGDVRETADGLAFRPAKLHGGVFATYDDHRLAMAAAVLGLVVPGLAVANVATTDKTLPGFARRWTELVSGRAA